jgi:hypothetical protein
MAGTISEAIGRANRATRTTIKPHGAGIWIMLPASFEWESAGQDTTRCDAVYSGPPRPTAFGEVIAL